MGKEEINKIGSIARKIIPKRKYDFLKIHEKGGITDQERQMIKEYEEANQPVIIPKTQIKPLDPLNKFELNESNLKKLFFNTWNENIKEQFICESEEEKKYYRELFYYFLKDKRFGSNDIYENVPSLDKGLLIIGSCGIGKSTFFEVLHQVGKEIYEKTGNSNLWFKKCSTNQIMSEIEGFEEKKYQKNVIESYIKTNRIYFDDFGTERHYFGDFIMKDILEERYRRGKISLITTNCTDDEIKKKYGFRIHDRFYKMCNIIIHPRLQSFRK